ncbi:MAG TPA: hypothetical protein PKD58_09710, partial [Candidatus Sumerlaeota bacterium]|nr:hypothetical protein [Candidatus Sumerlaeota bacterium]
MRSFSMPPQIVRLVLLTIGIVGSYLIARSFLTPASFGQYGWFRANAMGEIASLPRSYAGRKACAECHDDEQKKLAADGLHALCVEGDKRGLFVVVENHGGVSSNGKWLTSVMKEVNHSRVGILPDFGNFYTNRDNAELYNPYQGVREFMPWVKQAVSAK